MKVKKSNKEAVKDICSVIIVHKVPVVEELKFNRWIEEMDSSIKGFQGFIKSQIVRTEIGSSLEVMIVYQFESLELYRAWEKSSSRYELTNKLHQFITEPFEVNILENNEMWLNGNILGRISKKRVPRYKMVLITWLAIFPLSNLLPMLSSKIFPDVVWLNNRITISVVLVLLMTYIVMPVMSSIFSGWINNN